MGSYLVSFSRIGRMHDIPPLTASGDDEAVMDQICRYARPHLGSRDVEVVVNLRERRGYILVGAVRSAGEFTLAAEPEPANCVDGCWHLMSLHGPDGCTAKVFPSHSLTGEPCPCGRVPGETVTEAAP